MPTICMISGFGFYHSLGHFNNMLLEYVKGYALNSWTVLILDNPPSNASPFPSSIKDKVHVLPLKRLKLPISLRWDNKIRKYQISKQERLYHEQKLSDLFLAEQPRGLNRALFIVKFAINVLWTVREILKKGYQIDLFYGIEPYGAFASYLCGKLFNRPNISRYMGSWVYPGLQVFGKRFLFFYPDIYFGTKIPADLIIATNDGTKADLSLKLLGHASSKIKHWINGTPDMVDLLNIPKHPYPAFVTVSRLVPWKRVDRVIKGFSKAVRATPHAQLRIVGDGPMLNALQELVKHLKIEDRVVFLGRLSNHDALKEIRQAWAVVCAYDFSNLTNQVLEALSIGTPIITLNDGSTEDILQAGSNALLVDPLNSIEGLAEAIIALAQDPDLRERLSAEGLETAKEKLMPWPERMKMEVEAANELLSKRRINKGVQLAEKVSDDS